jgi:hypothetical protein
MYKKLFTVIFNSITRELVDGNLAETCKWVKINTLPLSLPILIPELEEISEQSV